MPDANTVVGGVSSTQDKRARRSACGEFGEPQAARKRLTQEGKEALRLPADAQQPLIGGLRPRPI